MNIGLIVAGRVGFPPYIARSSGLLLPGDLRPYSRAGNTPNSNARDAWSEKLGAHILC